MYEKKSFLMGRLIAHRGVHYQFLENTYEAFREAIVRGYIIELDVHLSLDREVVVFHDYTLFRLFGDLRFIKDMNLDDLRRYHILTLKEVLEYVHGRVPVLIELKVSSKKDVSQVISVLDSYHGEFAVLSFNPICLFYLKQKRKFYKVGLLFLNLSSLFFYYSFFCFLIHPYFVGINILELKSCKIQKLRKRYFVIGYTIKTEDEYLRYFSDADNFICDIPKGGLHKKTRDCSPEDSLPKRIKRVG